MTNPDRRGRLLPNSTPRYLRCYDNGGETIDRYTVVFTRLNTGYTNYLGMSGAPTHPQGFCQHGASRDPIDRPAYGHLGKKIAFADLPAACQSVVLEDYKAIWHLTTAAV